MAWPEVPIIILGTRKYPCHLPGPGSTPFPMYVESPHANGLGSSRFGHVCPAERGQLQSDQEHALRRMAAALASASSRSESAKASSCGEVWRLTRASWYGSVKMTCALTPLTARKPLQSDTLQRYGGRDEGRTTYKGETGRGQGFSFRFGFWGRPALSGGRGRRYGMRPPSPCLYSRV